MDNTKDVILDLIIQKFGKELIDKDTGESMKAIQYDGTIEKAKAIYHAAIAALPKWNVGCKRYNDESMTLFLRGKPDGTPLSLMFSELERRKVLKKGWWFFLTDTAFGVASDKNIRSTTNEQSNDGGQD